MFTYKLPTQLFSEIKTYLETQAFTEVSVHMKHFEQELGAETKILQKDLQYLADYLVMKPYKEVSALLNQIAKVPPVEAIAAPVPQAPEQAEPAVAKPAPPPIELVPDLAQPVTPPSVLTPEVVNPPAEEFPLAASGTINN